LLVVNDTADDFGIYMYSNVIQTADGLRIVLDNASSTGVCGYFKQDGTGDVLRLDDGAITVFTVKDGGNVLASGKIETTSTASDSIKTAGGGVFAKGVKVGDDTTTASVSNVGTLRYRESGDNSYIDCCMKVGASTYEWVEILRHSW